MTKRTRASSRTIYARIALSLSLAMLVVAGGLQSAHAAPKRLGVMTFRGPGEGATRNAVTKAGKAHKFEVVGGQQISKAASKLKVQLDSNSSFQAVARELGIAAFVTGEVSKKKATLTVRNGADGSVTAEASWTGPNPRKLSAAVNKTFWRRLGSAIERAKAPSGAKQAVVAQEEAAPETGADDPGDDDDAGKGKGKGGKKVAAASSDEGAGDRDRSSRSSTSTKTTDESAGSENVVSAKAEREEDAGGGSPLESLIVSVGPRFQSRSLAYNQNLSGGMNRNYSLPVGPALDVNLDVFPMALMGSGGFASNLGLTGHVAYMLPVVSTPQAGVGDYKTYALDWSVGAKVRFPVGAFATVAYGAQRYQLTRPTTGAPDLVPMVDYRYVRIGGGARIPVTEKITLMGNVAYLHLLSFGQIANASYFPRVGGRAVEVGVAGGYRITRTFELQAGVDLRRYGLAFNVTPADRDAGRRIAGGAVDQYLSGWIGVAMLFGGDSRAAGAAAASDDDSAKSDDEEKEEGDAEGEGDKKGEEDL